MTPLSRPAAIAIMVVAPLCWSMAGLATRQVESAGALEMAFWRSLFAAIAVAVICVATGRGTPWKAALSTGWRGLFSGAMWAIMFTAFIVALTLTTTANVLVVMSISPLLTAIAARLFLDEPIRARTWLAIIAASCGLLWMFGAGFEAREPREAWGLLLALTVPIASAANVVSLRKARERVDLIPAVMIGGVMSVLLVLPFALPFTGTGRDIALMAFLGFFQLGLPCMLLVIASRTLQAPEIALLGLLEVVFGPIWVWLGVGEVPATATLTGGAIVLAALAANAVGALPRSRSRP
jgi:drug/metabolite transporter (DMT)-like permease